MTGRADQFVQPKLRLLASHGPLLDAPQQVVQGIGRALKIPRRSGNRGEPLGGLVARLRDPAGGPVHLPDRQQGAPTAPQGPEHEQAHHRHADDEFGPYDGTQCRLFAGLRTQGDRSGVDPGRTGVNKSIKTGNWGRGHPYNSRGARVHEGPTADELRDGVRGVTRSPPGGHRRVIGPGPHRPHHTPSAPSVGRRRHSHGHGLPIGVVPSPVGQGKRAVALRAEDAEGGEGEEGPGEPAGLRPERGAGPRRPAAVRHGAGGGGHGFSPP